MPPGVPVKIEIAGLKRHRLRKMRDLIEHVEHQVPGIRRLPHLAVDAAAYIEVMHIADFIGCGDPGPDRRVGVERLSERPLRRAMLPGPFGDIIANAIAENVLGGASPRYVPPTLSDHGHKFDFIIDKVPTPWGFGPVRKVR